MKYWVFNDSRILGPYSREELAGIEAVHSGTLVCQEGTSGVADGDWRALEAVPELAGLALATAPAGGFGGSPYSETFDVSDPVGGAWPPPFADDPRFGFWMQEEAEAGRTVEFARTLAEMREQMARNERRQDEILDRLNAKDAQLQERDRELSDLRARLALYESGAARSAAQVPAPAMRAAPPPAAKAPAPAPAAKAAPAGPPPAQTPPPAAKAPKMPDLPPLAAKAPEAAPSLEMESALEAASPSLDAPLAAGETESPARAAMRAARAAKKGLPASSGPMEIALPDSGLTESGLPAFDPPAATELGVSGMPPALDAPFEGIPESEGLSPVSEVPPPLDFAPPEPTELGFAQPPPLDEPPPFAEAPLADLAAPPPLPAFLDPTYQPQAQPQLPGQFNHPQTVIFGGGGTGAGGPLNLTPSPSPLGPSPFGSTPEPIPLGDPGSMSTPMPTMGQPDLPQTVMQGLGVGGQATPFPFGQQTPLPRLPGQQPTSAFDQPITASPRPLETSPGVPPAVPSTAGGAKPSAMVRVKEMLRSKKFVIVLAVSVIALAAILAMFLRNPKQLAKTVDMAPDQTASGSFEENGPAPRTSAPSPFQKGPAEEAPPAESAPAPKPAAPSKGKDYVSDGSVRAIEFVKNYKLDEARGTIGAYLQYAFLGPDTTPGWQAGAIEKEIWFVQYNVFKGAPGGRGAKPTYSFRFEVDLGKRTVKGVNPSAVDMLNPGGSSEKPKRTQRRRPARNSQQPLPGDDDLDGSSSGSSGFNNPGG